VAQQVLRRARRAGPREVLGRDRSSITCAALVATGKTEQMSFHFPRAIENGVQKDELIEMITHLAFYVGWPGAMSAVAKLDELLGKAG
jgi:4-carboxymuconolactone decarboxylase